MRVSFTLLEWGEPGARKAGGGGGGEGLREGLGGERTFKNVFGALFPRLQKKKGHFLTEKESACQISTDSEQLGNLPQNSHKGQLAWSPSIDSLA